MYLKTTWGIVFNELSNKVKQFVSPEFTKAVNLQVRMMGMAWKIIQ